MNRKIMGIAITILAVAMLASPVMAVGPQNAEKNPNAISVLPWAQFVLPNGQLIEWVPTATGTILIQHKNADEFKINNAIELTITTPADLGPLMAAENKWIYLTQNSYANFLLFTGLPANLVPVFAGMYPDGLYIRAVLIGN